MKSETSLATIRSYLIGRRKDPDLDALAELAAAVTGKPYALISVLDGPLCWSKAECGFSVEPVPRELTFCSACVELDDVLIVENAALDERFAALPSVARESGVRFYAGVPVHVQAGPLVIDATLCVLDITPGGLEEEELKNLVLLAELLKSLLTAKLAAATDHLTGLWNKRTLEQTVDALVTLHRGTDVGVHFALLDVDHFKSYNDDSGHDAGDRVLQTVARLLQTLSPEDHVIGRLSGDEFAVVFASRDDADAARFLHALPDRLRFKTDKGDTVTLTAGYAHLTADMADGARLIKAADLALYEAKRRARGTAFRYGDLAA